MNTMIAYCHYNNMPVDLYTDLTDLTQVVLYLVEKYPFLDVVSPFNPVYTIASLLYKLDEEDRLIYLNALKKTAY